METPDIDIDIQIDIRHPPPPQAHLVRAGGPSGGFYQDLLLETLGAGSVSTSMKQHLGCP